MGTLFDNGGCGLQGERPAEILPAHSERPAEMLPAQGERPAEKLQGPAALFGTEA
jgi:hypothetical protein